MMLSRKWNMIRLLRLLMGCAIVIQAIVEKEVIFGLVGLAFAVMALFNFSCCGSGTCYTNSKKESGKEISYEEV